MTPNGSQKLLRVAAARCGRGNLREMNSRARIVGRRVAVVAVVAAQAFFVVRGYWSAHKEFAFQMFPESSTWQADIVRVTADGRRVPIAEPWAGYRWCELVAEPRPGRRPASATTPTPGSTTSWRSSTPPSTTSPPTRRATPRPQYLEAVVTTWHNTDDPQTSCCAASPGRASDDATSPRDAIALAASTSCSAAR